MTDPELEQLRLLADNARRALRASDRLNRIARQAVAQLTEKLEQTAADCAARGGTAHEQHRERQHAHA